MTQENQTVIAGCGGKTRYESHNAAQKHLDRMEKRGKSGSRKRKRYALDKNLKIYRCEVCGFYHMGNTS